MKTDGVNYFVGVPKDVGDALMINSIASSLWCEAVEKWAKTLKKSRAQLEDALSVSSDAKTRKRVLASMCKLGPVPYLHKALEADMLWRGEQRLILRRVRDRAASLADFIANPSCWDNDANRDFYVKDCKKKRALIRKFAETALGVVV